jgi:hypothetical protein
MSVKVICLSDYRKRRAAQRAAEAIGMLTAGLEPLVKAKPPKPRWRR